jgi:hypothetical protein
MKIHHSLLQSGLVVTLSSNAAELEDWSVQQGTGMRFLLLVRSTMKDVAAWFLRHRFIVA